MQHDQLLKCLKVRLQMQPNDASKKGMVQMFSHILRTDGVPGLYRGVCWKP